MLSLEKSFEIFETQQEGNSNELILQKLSEILNIKFIGNKNKSSFGNSTTHIMQETDRGTLCIRFYQKKNQHKLETGNPFFEIEALQFLKEHGFNVPIPLSFEDNYYLETDKQIIYCYYLIHGAPISQLELSVDLAAKIGTYLSDFLKVSVLFSSETQVFINSFQYILQQLEYLHSTITSSSIWQTMKGCTESNINILDGTPTGLVHADFFYENILIDEGKNVIGLIDFGDAYYGHVLHDVTIGAMEASILQREIWSFENLASFLTGVVSFLKSYNISFEQFYETVKVDCFRFAMYTFSKNSRQEMSFESNDYVKRYKILLEGDFEQKISDIFYSVISV